MENIKTLLPLNVYEAAKSRIEWAFDTFHHVCISFSGGKDSTVLFHLVAEVAKIKKRKTIAPMEKKLLLHSLEKDGFTQPIVTAKVKDHNVVVDGFHRHLLGKKTASLHKKLHGYLPVSLVNADSEGLNDRIASTVRHNRARGKHRVEAMSDIVRDLARQGWDDQRISQELGMDADEVLRLKQISGLAEIFSEETFSEAWTVR